MEENKNLAVEEVIAENAENPAEETPIYTESQFNQKVKATVDEAIGKKIARREAKIRKEYERKYGALEDVLKAGTGKQSVEEMTDSFKSFYENKGIDIPQRPEYSPADIEILAKAEAEDIIRLGFDEAVEEADLLNQKGNAMTAKEKAVFRKLTDYIKLKEKHKELEEIGVTADVYESPEFIAFASKFNSDTPISEIYDYYNKTKPKKEIKTMGSVKNTTADDSGIKEFYTPEEARKFTQKEINDNPALLAAIERSMRKWK